MCKDGLTLCFEEKHEKKRTERKVEGRVYLELKYQRQTFCAKPILDSFGEYKTSVGMKVRQHANVASMWSTLTVWLGLPLCGREASSTDSSGPGMCLQMHCKLSDLSLAIGTLFQPLLLCQL